MSDHDGIERPVYPVGARSLSIRDLLVRFSDAEFLHDGVSRLSDLHLKVGEPACYRLDDRLEALPEATPLTAEIVERLVLPLLNRRQIEQLSTEPPRDVDAGFELPGAGLCFRLNVFRDREGLACAIRVLPRTIPELERVGFPGDGTWQAIVGMRQGLVVVTGVTGSGKSTTVAALLQRINRERAVRVITLEDPIEYVLTRQRALISQRELGRHIRTFRGGLRAALREDPDIIFIGEIRDRPTCALALSAAETGHLVLTTMHTKDARGAVTRIVDMFPEERTREVQTQLSFSLSCVLAQKLVPLKGGRGRRVAMEVLRNVPAVANLIRTGRWEQIYSTMEAHRKSGLITLERHLTELVRGGEIDAATAERYANEPALVHR